MKDKSTKMLAGWDVILLEDEPDSMEVAKIILTMYGASVYTGTNGQDGLNLLKTIKPHFIISDLSMPLVDGWEFIKVLKKDRELAEIPVIALSAHSFDSFRSQAIMAGFHNFMAKPLTPSTFISDLLNLLVDRPELKALMTSE